MSSFYTTGTPEHHMFKQMRKAWCAFAFTLSRRYNKPQTDTTGIELLKTTRRPFSKRVLFSFSDGIYLTFFLQYKLLIS